MMMMLKLYYVRVVLIDFLQEFLARRKKKGEREKTLNTFTTNITDVPQCKDSLWQSS